MFNQNSPIIQQMLNGINNQQTVGNFTPEFYRGASPSVYYADPMQMAQQIHQKNYGMNAVNPLIMNGYSNPYFVPTQQVPNFSVAVNSYTPNFNNYGRTVYPYDPTMDPYYGFDPYDQNSRSIMQNALYSGLTYMEQINIESEIMKKAMGIFLKDNREYSPERKEEIQKYYSVQEKKKTNTLFNPIQFNPKSSSTVDCSNVEIVISRGSDIVYRSKDNVINKVDEYTLAKCEMDVQYEPILQTNFKNHVEYLKQRDAYLYATALEREADGMDMYDFMEKVGPKIIRQMKEEDARKQRYLMLTDVYSSDSFRKILEKNTGKKINKPNEIRGRNGILPNGMMVSTGVDPRIAEGFVRDPSTGRITLTVPDFIKNRIDDSPFKEGILQKEMDNRKAAFMRSLHDNTVREEIFNRGG